MSYSLDSIADNCYPETAVLINKLGIRDEALLNDVDGDLLMIATIQAANGVRDLLNELFEQLIH